MTRWEGKEVYYDPILAVAQRQAENIQRQRVALAMQDAADKELLDFPTQQIELIDTSGRLIRVPIELASSEGYRDMTRAKPLNYAAPTWQTEPPTEDGYYWAIENGGWSGIVDVCVGEGVAYKWYSLATISDFTHWWPIPITMPEPPEAYNGFNTSSSDTNCVWSSLVIRGLECAGAVRIYACTLATSGKRGSRDVYDG